MGGKTLIHRHRWLKEVPLRDGAAPRLVDRVGVTITADLVFPDGNTVMQTLIDAKPPSDVDGRVAR